MNILNLNLNRKFDLTTSFEVIEHVPRNDLKAFFDTIKKHSDIHVCSIHTSLPEHYEHQTIMSRESWQQYFNDNNIKYKYIDNFPVSHWKCSAFFELNLTEYVF